MTYLNSFNELLARLLGFILFFLAIAIILLVIAVIFRWMNDAWR